MGASSTKCTFSSIHMTASSIEVHAPVCILEKQEALDQTEMIALSTFLKMDSLLQKMQQSVFIPSKNA